MGVPIVLTALKRFGDALVRIDWYGDVVQSRIPLVTLSCSPCEADSPETTLLRRPSLNAKVPVALLRFVRLGDVWKQGQRVGRAPLDRKTFQALKVDDTTTSLVPCGRSFSGDDNVPRHELPFPLFQKHSDHTKAFVARVEIDSATVLLVPSMELIRFYFGTSGALLANIFSGALGERHLYESAEKDPATGEATLQLAAGIPGIAAATVARIAFNTTARRQMKAIVDTGVVAASTRTAWYPRVGFPFQGTTDLTVEGLWLERPSDRAFVVHRLVSCTHPFPFTNLYYLTDVTTTTSLTKAATATTDEGDPPPVGKGFELRTGSKDTALAPALITTAVDDEAVAFPDLASKRVVRVKSTADRGMQGRPKPAEGGEDLMELGIGDHEKDGLRGAHVAPEGLPSETIAEPPDPLQKAVQAARRLSENLRAVAPLGKSGTSRIETCSDEGQKVAFWVTRFDFYRSGMALGSRLVLAAEESAGTNRPALLMFEAPDDASWSDDAWIDRAIVFWADDERRQEVARRHGLCGHWTADELAGQDGDVILASLLEQVGVGFEAHDAAEVAPATDFSSLRGTCPARHTLPDALAKVLELPWRAIPGLNR